LFTLSPCFVKLFVTHPALDNNKAEDNR
jgi:hypothetical protein